MVVAPDDRLGGSKVVMHVWSPWIVAIEPRAWSSWLVRPFVGVVQPTSGTTVEALMRFLAEKEQPVECLDCHGGSQASLLHIRCNEPG